ncbi:MAG TPA: TolC family protein [Candidatus Cybelea sp.]|nr:TolC family protein [Candidatus Cybelea sp.]
MKAPKLPVLIAGVAVVVATLPMVSTSAQTTPPAVAPGYRAPAVQPSAEIVGVAEKPFVSLTLQDAVGLALLQNPNLAVSAANYKVARYVIAQTKGAFDVALHLQPSSNFSDQPPENLFFAGPGGFGYYQCFFFGTYHTCGTNGPGDILQHQYSVAGGVQGQTVNGMLWSAGITRTRTYNNTIVDTFNPYYQSSLNLTVSQPLLKDLGMNAAKRQLKLSLINADAAAAQTLVDTSNLINEVEDAYWDLVAAWRNVAIQEEALREAIAQEHSVIDLARKGAAAPVEATEVQTQVANSQDAVFSALRTVAETQNHLKGLILADPKDQIWYANLVPSSPAQQLPSAGDLSQIIELGQENRPEMRAAQDRRRQADLDHAYAKNQMLPQANLQVQLESNGFAGVLAPVPGIINDSCSFLPNGCPTPPPETQGKMGKATANMWAFRYPTFNVALSVNFPLQNDFARGLKQAAKQEQYQAAVGIQGVQERIAVEARNGLQAYQSALSRLYAARISRESAESVYASEVRKFHAGESTTFLVLQRQTELAQARGRELQAQTDLNKAVVELQRVQGTILATNNVDLQTIGTKALASASPVPMPSPSPSPTSKG